MKRSSEGRSPFPMGAEFQESESLTAGGGAKEMAPRGPPGAEVVEAGAGMERGREKVE